MASEKEKQTRQSAKSEKSEKVKEPKARQQSGEKKSGGSARSENKQSVSKLEAGKSARTIDHDRIRQWVEERGGSPAAVKATEKGEDPGLLRINFPGYSGAGQLEDISWEDFFQKFDEKNLEFLFQDETRDGKTSRFWKFVTREGKK
jgi:hypothetical protein